MRDHCIKWFTLFPSGGKVTLPPEGRKVTLPPSNKGEQEIFRDDKGCNWIQNGINEYIHFDKHENGVFSKTAL